MPPKKTRRCYVIKKPNTDINKTIKKPKWCDVRREVGLKIKLLLYELDDDWIHTGRITAHLAEYEPHIIGIVFKMLATSNEVEQQHTRNYFKDGIPRYSNYYKLPDHERKRLDKLFNKDTFTTEKDVIAWLNHDCDPNEFNE